MGLQDWAFRVAYAGRSEMAWRRVVGRCSDTWKRGSLAGHIEGHSVARGRVRGILRSVLRPALQPVLQGIFRATLRNQEIRRVERGANGVRKPG